MCPSYELVIFDCDGVLVDSERLVIEIDAAVLAELGWQLTAAEVVELFMGTSHATMLAIVADRLGQETAATYEQRSEEQIREVFATELRAVAGAAELLGDLAAAGVPTCVASSGTHDKMGRTLRTTGLWELVEGRIFSATEVARGKPAPDLFLHAAASVGAVPARCAVIEDSVFGVRGAVAAGMTVFGYVAGLAPPGALAAAGAVPFERMEELLPMLTGG